MFKLVKFCADDFELYAQLVFNERVMGMNLGRVFTEEEAHALFNFILTVDYCKVYLNTGEYIGIFGAVEIGDVVELEYMLLPEYWGRGYATALVAGYIKTHHEQKLRAITDPKNIASIKVLEKNGFDFICEFSNADGENAALYELVNSWE